MSVPERVRQRRVELDLSQTRLAGIAGVNPATVNGIEAGTRSPSVRTLEKLAGALDVTPAYFLEEDSPKAPSRPSPEAPEEADGEERRSSEDVWKAEYIARANELLDKWEDELEEKLALAETDPARFLEWVQELREFGTPHMAGIVSGFIATAPTKLQAVVTVANFLGPWDDLWHRIDDRMKTAGLELTEEDQKRFQEAYKEARSLTAQLEGKD